MPLRLQVSPAVTTKEGASKLPKRKSKLLREFVTGRYAKSRIRDLAADLLREKKYTKKAKLATYSKPKKQKIDYNKLFNTQNYGNNTKNVQASKNEKSNQGVWTKKNAYNSPKGR